MYTPLHVSMRIHPRKSIPSGCLLEMFLVPITPRRGGQFEGLLRAVSCNPLWRLSWLFLFWTSTAYAFKSWASYRNEPMTRKCYTTSEWSSDVNNCRDGLDTAPSDRRYHSHCWKPTVLWSSDWTLETSSSSTVAIFLPHLTVSGRGA